MTAAKIDGPGLTPEDQVELKGQLGRVKQLMLDGRWRTFREIIAQVGGTEASISARLRDLRKAKFGRFDVQRRTVGKRIYEYRVNPESGRDPSDEAWRQQSLPRMFG